MALHGPSIQGLGWKEHRGTGATREAWRRHGEFARFTFLCSFRRAPRPSGLSNVRPAIRVSLERLLGLLSRIAMGSHHAPDYAELFEGLGGAHACVPVVEGRGQRRDRPRAPRRTSALAA